MNLESAVASGPNRSDSVDSASGQVVNYGRCSRSAKPLRRCLLATLIALASYFLVSHYVLQTVQVVGVSMTPTLQDSDRYLLNLCVYHFRDPRPGEVVVIRDPIDNGFDVKRVIAAAGDLVYLSGGHVYVNGRELKEPYLPPGTRTFTFVKFDGQRIRCGKDEYFVLGDNRKSSADSRVFGPVSRRSILGLVVR